MKQKLAIVGSGIAGMGCAHFLQKEYDITIFEKNDYVGGHTNTVVVDEGGDSVYIDTGFMVFNQVNYPNLCRLFNEIGNPIMKTEMSFSVQHVPSNLEYCGSGINGLFAQRKNIFNPKYIKMLMQIARFNKESVADMQNPTYSSLSIGDYVKMKGYGEEMLNKYLVPMSSAVWSTPMDKMLDFPASSLIQFFKNHGFLGLDTQHQWYTPVKGSQSYRSILIAPFKDKIKLNAGVKSIRRAEQKITLILHDNSEHDFDKVIFAAHANETLAILGNEANAQENNLLKNFKYQQNIATLHTDESIMPKTRQAWSSWNYRMEQSATNEGGLVPSTIYWMNSLQKVSDKKNYFVSINDPGGVNPGKVIKTIVYEHPLFDIPAINAQASLQQLNQQNNNTYFCGSYFRFGFHEDAFTSAVDCSRAVLGKEPW